jgi:adenosylcobinamide-GDP ribazoletransferase
MAILMASLPNARGTGLSQSVGRPGPQTAGLAALLAVGVALILLGPIGVVAAIAVAVTTLAVAAIARAKIGGQTGDILGASQQLAEVAVLAVLVSQ